MLRFRAVEMFARADSVLVVGVLSDGGQNIGKRQISLAASEVVRIYHDDQLTDVEKNSALRALAMKQVRHWRLSEADEAIAILNECLPKLTIAFTPKEQPRLRKLMQRLRVIK